MKIIQGLIGNKMGIFGLAKKGFGLLGKKKKPLESKTYKNLKKRKRDDAIFKGVLGGGALTGYVGIRLESYRKKNPDINYTGKNLKKKKKRKKP